MEVKAKCKFDYDSIKALAHLQLSKKSPPMKKLIVWSVFELFLAAIIILEIIFFSEIKLVILLVLLLVIFLLRIYLYFLVPKIRYKALGKMKETENEYIFGDEILKVHIKNDGIIGETEVKYSFFVKVYETSQYFFLFQTNNQVYIVNKSTIEDGTAEEIKNKLLQFVGKYIVCKY